MNPCRKCGVVPDPIPSRWNRSDYICNSCHNAYCKPRGYKGGKMPRSYHRAYEKAYYARAEVKAKRASLMRRYSKSPELRQHHEARWILNRAIASGKITRLPCACGNAKSQAHHEDYAKPLEVKWLCRPCHQAEHAKAEGGR